MSTPKPQPQTVTSTQNSSPWSGQQPFLTKGFGEAERIYNQGPQTFFPGQTYANPDAATLAGLSATEARARAGSPLIGQAQGEVGKTLAGDYLGAGNPYLQGMFDRNAAEIMPRVQAQFRNAGGPGGLQTRAAALALADANNALMYQNYGDERNRMTNALAAAPGLAQADYVDPSMLGQVGAAREGIAQKGIDEAIARHDYGQMAEANALAQYMATIGSPIQGQTVGTTQQLIPQQNPWLTGIGTALGIGGLGLGFARLSDERLKTDIKRVGKTDDGLDIYTYRYKWGGPPMMGVMAQDVAEVKPEAVSVAPLFGKPFLAVDYSKVN